MSANQPGSTMVITITRAEGPSIACGIPHSFRTFADANALLRKWADTVNKDGGYDKCDFQLSDPAIELEYLGRYDLEHYTKKLPDLKNHVISHLDFISGQCRPSHMSEEMYDHLINDVYKFDQAYKEGAIETRNHLSMQA